MKRLLPPGIWDNPRPEDIQAYNEFVLAYLANEGQYLQYYQEYLQEDGSDVQLRALAYSCVTRGLNTKVGHHVTADIPSDAGDGWWYDITHDFETDQNRWGVSFVYVAQPGVDLPPSEDLPPIEIQGSDQTAFNPATTIVEPTLSAQHEGVHEIHSFYFFSDVQVPNSAKIHYAYIELVAKAVESSTYTGDIRATIGAEDSTNPTAPVDFSTASTLANNQTTYRVFWNHGVDDWTSGNTYETSNIACVIQEIVDKPGWSSGNNIQIVFLGDSTNTSYGVLEAKDVGDGDAPILHIYYASVITETMSGGVLAGGRALVEPEDFGTETWWMEGLPSPIQYNSLLFNLGTETRWHDGMPSIIQRHGGAERYYQPVGGGILLDGEAVVVKTSGSQTYNETMSGGVKLDGDARFNVIRYGLTSGGIKLNGTAGNTVYDYNVSTGGVKLNSTSYAPFRDIVEVSGGIKLNGAARDVVYDYNIASGGIKLNGAARQLSYHYIRMSSGILLDGESFVEEKGTFNEVMSGGVKLNGTAGHIVYDYAVMTGGVVLNGTAPTPGRLAETMSGGVKLNGTSYYPFRDIVETSGGIELDGASIPTVRYNPVVSGGVELDGSSYPGYTSNPTASGGIKLNGSGIIAARYNPTASGGVELDGASTQPGTYNITVSGGVVLNGAARQTFNDIAEVSGGVKLNGSGVVAARYAPVASGGVELDSTATPVVRYNPVPIGGVELDGVHRQTFFDYVAMSGGVLLDGEAGIYETGIFDETMVGGIRVNGAARQTFYDVFVPTGGVQLDGSWFESKVTSPSMSGGVKIDGRPQVYTNLRYWVGTDNNWNDPANWAGASGEEGGVPVPDSSSYVFFDGGGLQNCSLVSSVNIARLTMEPGYAGYTLDTSLSNHTLTVSGNMVVGGGTFDYNSSTVNVGGNFDSTAPGTITSDVSLSNLIFNGSGNQSVDLDGLTVGNVNVDKTTGTVTFTSGFTAEYLSLFGNTDFNGVNVTVNADLQWGNNATVWFGEGHITVHGECGGMEAVTLYLESSTLEVKMSLSFQLATVEYPATGTILFTGTGTQDLTSAGQTLPHIDIDKDSGSFRLMDLTTANNVTVVDGEFNFNGKELDCNIFRMLPSTTMNLAGLAGAYLLPSKAYFAGSDGALLDLRAAAPWYLSPMDFVSYADWVTVANCVVADATIWTVLSEDAGGNTLADIPNNNYTGWTFFKGAGLAGTATTTRTYSINFAGGIKLNGTTTATARYNPVPTGGLKLNGSATGPATYAIPVSGGIKLNGSAINRVYDYNVMSGGVKLNGASTQPGTYNIVTTGGVKLNGTSYYPFRDVVEVGGGIKLNSTAIAVARYSPTVSGGAKLNGTARMIGSDIIEVGGGISLGGDSVVWAVYTQRETINLFRNGYGELGDNSNFSGWTFDAVDKYQGGGSFLVTSSGSVNKTSDDYIKVNQDLTYPVSVWGKSGDIGGGNYDPAAQQLTALVNYDADKRHIETWHVMRFPGAVDTTLAVELKTGDSTMTLTDASGWCNSGQWYQKCITWWPYTNDQGHTYPDYTYSRNFSGNHAVYNSTAGGMWADGAVSGNVITLRAPWPGANLPAGTPVRNTTASATYNYCFGVAYHYVPTTWTLYRGYIGAAVTPWNGTGYSFRYGCEYVRFFDQCNSYGTIPNSIRYNLFEMLWQISPVASLSGSTTSLATYNITPSGGAKLNGSADVEVLGAITVEGGVKVNGTARVQAFSDRDVTGGLKLDGAASHSATYNHVVWAPDIIPIPMLPEAGNRKPGSQPNIMSNQFKGLASWWLHGELGGMYAYDPVSGNTGIVTAPNWVVDSNRGAYVFELNGTSDYINCGRGRQLSRFGQDLTASIWVNPRSYPVTGYDVILSKQSDYEIGLDSSGHVCFRLAGSWGTWTDTGRVVSQDVWTLVTLTVKGGVATIYLNGRSS